MPRKPTQPTYRLHKPRNLAVVTIDGKNHYLGPWQSPESHEKYATLIAEWKRLGGSLSASPPATAAAPSLLTVNELILAFFKYAQTHYVKRGEPTSEQGCIRQALRPVRQLYGSTLAIEFGPRALKNARQSLIASDRSRKSINKDVHRIKRMFRWAVEEELLPSEVYMKLRCVAALKKGKTNAREIEKVAPVPEEHVFAILPHLPPPVAAMVQFQLLTGTRPQEAIHIRPCDITEGEGDWYYAPSIHKTEHYEREKCIVLGPKAMAVILPFLNRTPEAYCFSPAESVAWRHSRRPKRLNSVSTEPLAPAKYVNQKYTRHSYRVAVQRACKKANVPIWSPGQLRHTRATQIRHEFGNIEAAKAVLGHTDTRVTEIYADRDLKLAADVMRKMG